jgi:hypothetical protein
MPTNFHDHTSVHRVELEKFLCGKPLDKEALIKELKESSDGRVKDLCRILLMTIGKRDRELAGIEGNLDGYLIAKHSKKIKPLIKIVR